MEVKGYRSGFHALRSGRKKAIMLSILVPNLRQHFFILIKHYVLPLGKGLLKDRILHTSIKVCIKEGGKFMMKNAMKGLLWVLVGGGG